MAGASPDAHVFERPEGTAGAVAGRIMAGQNARAERWAAWALPAVAGPVLEVGCGPGVGLCALGGRGVGIDVSAAMVRQARQRAPGAAVVRADAAALPFADGVYGAAMLVHCLGLLPDAGLTETRRVLREGAPVLALHRPPAQGGPEPSDLRQRMRGAGFQDVRCDRGMGRTAVWARA